MVIHEENLNALPEDGSIHNNLRVRAHHRVLSRVTSIVTDPSVCWIKIMTGVTIYPREGCKKERGSQVLVW